MPLLSLFLDPRANAFSTTAIRPATSQVEKGQTGMRARLRAAYPTVSQTATAIKSSMAGNGDREAD